MPAQRARIVKGVSLEKAEVQDPVELGRTLFVYKNRRVDILAWEHSHDRLSLPALLVGRIIQHLFERGTSVRARNPQWRTRVDSSPQIDESILRALSDANTRCRIHEWLRNYLAESDIELLRKILTDGWDFRMIAGLRGKQDSGYERRQVAKRLRKCLEDLADSWPTRPRILVLDEMRNHSVE